MRPVCSILLLALAGNLSLSAQSVTPPPPQSARQALLEMFFGKGENDFQKHLPEDARQTLIHKGETPETSTILRISTIGRQMTGQSQHFEIFETGPVLLSGVVNEHEKFEINVDRDSLIGEADEIELSVHYYKDAQLQALPVVPDLIFTLKQEKFGVSPRSQLRRTSRSPIPTISRDYASSRTKRRSRRRRTGLRQSPALKPDTWGGIRSSASPARCRLYLPRSQAPILEKTAPCTTLGTATANGTAINSRLVAAKGLHRPSSESRPFRPIRTKA